MYHISSLYEGYLKTFKSLELRVMYVNITLDNYFVFPYDILITVFILIS